MEKIDISKIKGYEFILELLDIASNKWEEIYLVGGAVRDYFLGRASCDFDFVVPEKEDVLARRFANRLKGKFFVLGDREKVARVVLRRNDKLWKFDFTKFRGKDIYDDLEKRDFTINAIALSLKDSHLIDIFDGFFDIKKRVLNPVTDKIFIDDPLRVLRAFRLSYSLSFYIPDSLYELIERDKSLLVKVSGERIRDELFELLKLSDFHNALLELYEKKVLEVIFPGIIYDYELFDRYRKIVNKELKDFLCGYEKEIFDYLAENTSSMRNKKEILTVSLLFLFSFFERADIYIDKLRLTRNEVKIIKALISTTKRYLQGEKPSLFNIYLLPIFVQDEIPGISLLLYLFDKFSLSCELLNIYYNKILPGRRLPRFINGDILQEKWGLSEGPKIKEVLDKVRVAQIEGKISTKEDAFKFVDEYIRTFDQ